MPALLAAIPSYVPAVSVALLVLVFTALYAWERDRRRGLECSRAAAESARKVLGLELERISKNVSEVEQSEGRLKARLLSGVAERLRVPLEDITARVRLWKRRADGSGTDPKELVAHVSEEMARLEDLIESLQDLARLEAGEVEWKDQEVEPETILGKASTQADAAALRRCIRIETEVRGNLPPVHGDPDRLAQVLAKLLDNAIKFSPEGAVVRMAAFTQGSEVAFSVCDSGQGIADEELERLLENLEEIGVALGESRGSSPLGIGLSICRLIVKRHGGRFWSETRKGSGSEFGFVLDGSDGENSSDKDDPM